MLLLVFAFLSAQTTAASHFPHAQLQTVFSDANPIQHFQPDISLSGPFHPNFTRFIITLAFESQAVCIFMLLRLLNRQVTSILTNILCSCFRLSNLMAFDTSCFSFFHCRCSGNLTINQHHIHSLVKMFCDKI